MFCTERRKSSLPEAYFECARADKKPGVVVAAASPNGKRLGWNCRIRTETLPKYPQQVCAQDYDNLSGGALKPTAPVVYESPEVI